MGFVGVTPRGATFLSAWPSRNTLVSAHLLSRRVRRRNGSLNSTEKELDNSYAYLPQFSYEVLLPAVVNHRLGSDLNLTTIPD